MAQETLAERRLERKIGRASTPRGAAVVIASVTTTITVIAGIAMWAIDRSGFPTIGSGMWWAVQTVTTVGYGDHVPTTSLGQALATAVMLLGIGFVTVITAAITSAFVTRRRAELEPTDGTSTADQLAQIIERLERIETSLRKEA